MSEVRYQDDTYEGYDVLQEPYAADDLESGNNNFEHFDSPEVEANRARFHDALNHAMTIEEPHGSVGLAA